MTTILYLVTLDKTSNRKNKSLWCTWVFVLNFSINLMVSTLWILGWISNGWTFIIQNKSTNHYLEMNRIAFGGVWYKRCTQPSALCLQPPPVLLHCRSNKCQLWSYILVGSNTFVWSWGRTMMETCSMNYARLQACCFCSFEYLFWYQNIKFWLTAVFPNTLN